MDALLITAAVYLCFCIIIMMVLGECHRLQGRRCKPLIFVSNSRFQEFSKISFWISCFIGGMGDMIVGPVS